MYEINSYLIYLTLKEEAHIIPPTANAMIPPTSVPAVTTAISHVEVSTYVTVPMLLDKETLVTTQVTISPPTKL